MNDLSHCDPARAAMCAGSGAENYPRPIMPAEALAGFDREAVRGTCDTGRYRMPYYIWGEGPPLLFVHGLWDSSRSFLMPISRLSTHFRCIAYDQPAGGADGSRLGSYTYDDLLADVWALLDHVSLKQSYIVGSSFGSLIVLGALRQQPRRLPRAVLQGGLAHRPLRRAELLLARIARLLPGTADRLPLRRRALHRILGDSFANQPPEVWDYFLQCNGRPRLAAIGWQALLLQRLDLRPVLPEIRQPVLLLCGENDRIVGPRCEEELLRDLPNVGRVVLEGCGHVPSHTHPEAYALVLRRFFTPPGPNQA